MQQTSCYSSPVFFSWCNSRQKQEESGLFRDCVMHACIEACRFRFYDLLQAKHCVPIMFSTHPPKFWYKLKVHKGALMPHHHTDTAPVCLMGPIALPGWHTPRHITMQRLLLSSRHRINTALWTIFRPSQSVQLLFGGCRGCWPRLLSSLFDSNLK